MLMNWFLNYGLTVFIGMLITIFVIWSIITIKNIDKPKFKKVKIGSTTFIKDVYQIRLFNRTPNLISPVSLKTNKDRDVAELIGYTTDSYAAKMVFDFNAVIYKFKRSEFNLNTYGDDRISKYDYMVVYQNKEDAEKALDWVVSIAVERKLSRG